MKKRIHIYFSGMVQGVGFRFTAERVALDLGVHGWVKNLFEGRVEVVAEGEETILADFLNKMKNGPLKRYITGTDVTWHDATGEFRDFTIRFY